MNQLNILYYKVLEDDKLFPVTPQAQAIFDEVVLERDGNHIQQLMEWNQKQNPRLFIQFLEDVV